MSFKFKLRYYSVVLTEPTHFECALFVLSSLFCGSNRGCITILKQSFNSHTNVDRGCKYIPKYILLINVRKTDNNTVSADKNKFQSLYYRTNSPITQLRLSIIKPGSREKHPGLIPFVPKERTNDAIPDKPNHRRNKLKISHKTAPIAAAAHIARSESHSECFIIYQAFNPPTQ